MMNDVKKATPTRNKPKRMPKSVTTDFVKEDMSDVTTIITHSACVAFIESVTAHAEAETDYIAYVHQTYRLQKPT